ncbi:GFA family protein [Novosphingobium sp. M1R2S20]|uniref:GFA family protein n=1 Tax=Novosphingobium rhizovicinum TaxID=3228928 RepID=A0ABV3RCL9_9SPHN
MIETHCLCGTVALKITAEPLAQVYCHCSDCQISQAAAYVLNSVYPADAVQITSGEPIAMTVNGTPRLRCPACATPLFTEVASAGLRSLNAYLLPEGTFTPQMHLHCADAVLPVIDALPHYARLPLSFGGSDELVDW